MSHLIQNSFISGPQLTSGDGRDYQWARRCNVVSSDFKVGIAPPDSTGDVSFTGYSINVRRPCYISWTDTAIVKTSVNDSRCQWLLVRSY